MFFIPNLYYIGNLCLFCCWHLQWSICAYKTSGGSCEGSGCMYRISLYNGPCSDWHLHASCLIESQVRSFKYKCSHLAVQSILTDHLWLDLSYLLYLRIKSWLLYTVGWTRYQQCLLMFFLTQLLSHCNLKSIIRHIQARKKPSFFICACYFNMFTNSLYKYAWSII